MWRSNLQRKYSNGITAEEIYSNGVTSISPTGENERGLKMIREVTPNNDYSPHLTSPVGEGQIAMAAEGC